MTTYPSYQEFFARPDSFNGGLHSAHCRKHPECKYLTKGPGRSLFYVGRVKECSCPFTDLVMSEHPHHDARESRILRALPAKVMRRRMSAQDHTTGSLRRVRTRRLSWHASKAAWEQTMLSNLDPNADARADLQADRAADWKEMGF